MLKRRFRVFAIMGTLAALLFLIGCGSGDSGGVGRVSTTELVTHSEDTGGTPPPNGGNPGGPGACVWDGFNVCYEGYSEINCQAIGTYTPNVTCQSLGFGNCATYAGITVCQ